MTTLGQFYKKYVNPKLHGFPLEKLETRLIIRPMLSNRKNEYKEQNKMVQFATMTTLGQFYKKYVNPKLHGFPLEKLETRLIIRPMLSNRKNEYKEQNKMVQFDLIG